jgi:hypothetical protein
MDGGIAAAAAEAVANGSKQGTSKCGRGVRARVVEASLRDSWGCAMFYNGAICLRAGQTVPLVRVVRLLPAAVCDGRERVRQCTAAVANFRADSVLGGA